MIHAFIIGSVLFAFGHHQNLECPKWSYYGAFLISSITTIATGYYFVVHLQSGDTLAYFQSAVEFNKEHAANITSYLEHLLSTEFPEHSSNWHSIFFVKTISPIVYLADGNYWLTGLYLTLFNFILSWIAMRYLIAIFNRKWLIYLSIFLIPSVNIWSGGIFKEAIANPLFLILVSITLYRVRRYSFPSLPEWTLMLLGSIILLESRFYLFGIWIIFSFTCFWIETFSKQKIMLWGGLGIVIIAGFLGAQLLHPWLRPSRLPLTLFEIYEQFQATPSSSSFSLGTFQPDYWHLVISSPLALLTGLFRPSFTDIQSFYWIPFQIEKLLILVLTLLSLWKVRRIEISQTFWIAVFFISILTISLTLVTPNFGSLMRYESAYLPFLVITIGWIPLRKVDLMN
ncbi:MAG: hypothetical protein ACO2ZZ_10275 [Cyclobacteriaceae bacterium]